MSRGKLKLARKEEKVRIVGSFWNNSEPLSICAYFLFLIAILDSGGGGEKGGNNFSIVEKKQGEKSISRITIKNRIL